MCDVGEADTDSSEMVRDAVRDGTLERVCDWDRVNVCEIVKVSVSFVGEIRCVRELDTDGDTFDAVIVGSGDMDSVRDGVGMWVGESVAANVLVGVSGGVRV
jgi:hypothetical protein